MTDKRTSIMAITASFSPSARILSIFGDAAQNKVTISRTASGNILVNGGAVSVIGGKPTIANTGQIQAFGLAGDDVITLDESNGALPAANLFGGDGNDTLTGGSGADQLFGQSGNDTLNGKGGNDFLFGGDGNDTLIGGTGDDQMFGQGGNDRMIWNPGDGTDLMEGGDGTDTAEVNGGNGAETFTITANGSRVRFDRVSPAPFSLDIGTTENLVLNAGGGDDVITAGNGLANLIKLTIDGGAGNDTITGGDGNDTLIGGDGNDTIAGGRGNDVALLGAGDDRFVWNPGDGSDTVEGQSGTDTLQFNGANVNEKIDISANGGRARLFRDVANITMDLNDVEHINVAALGGADTITVNDLSGTDVTQVAVDLAATGGAGDGAADTVIVNGTAANNQISVVDGSGTSVVVNGLPAQVIVTGAEAANDTLVVNGLAGNDVINASALDAGRIRLTLDGGAGNDTLIGSRGNDMLLGGDGNDTITGGTGDDLLFGQGGNDRMIWNPGDGTDLMEGGDGTDTAEVNGGNGAETFTITANGSRVRFDRISPAPFSLDIGTTENLVLNAGGGDDVITAGNGLANLIQLTIDGGAGNDTITGGDGNDTLLGGDGNDTIAGGRGNDVALLGAGDDRFIWNPGDGSDTVEGQSGTDTLQFNGANVNEKIDISANGGRVRLTRDVANITMDLNDVEHINVAALGGADTITVNDLSGTDVTQVTVDLAATGGAGDGAADTVIVNGTAGSNHITLAGSGSSVVVNGLPAQVMINGTEGGNDVVVVNALAGNDTIDASLLNAGVLQHLTIDGGAGNDIIVGSRGADVLIGGDGNDTVTGGGGDDTVLLGAGDDRFTWNPGDGSDVVEGQAGTDTLVFNGSNAGENMDISANGGRVRLFRDVGNITMDLNGIEQIQLAASGGADTITVNDLAGTGVTQVAIDLAATGATSGDGQPDRVIVNGTNGNDTITVAGSGSTITVNGLAAQVTVAHVEGASDSLTVNGLGGDDVINASAVKAGQVNLTLNGGDGNDTITGSAGNDVVNGGRGNDVALLGAGNDTFVWNPGDGSDTVEGQSGTDTLQFNGANINEKIDISANGSRVRLTRDVANIVMDVNGVENINVAALGGADAITVNDLTGTGVKQVGLDLGHDGQADTITINATNGDDVITVTNNNGVVTVKGLGEDIVISNFDADDRLVINGLGGDDVIEASGLNGMQLTANGGDGDDVLIGSAGNDILTGGAGDDVLIGGPGQDVLDGGPGDNIQIQSIIASPGGAAMQGDAAHAAGMALLGQFMASTFVAAGDGHGATPIAEMPQSQPPLLAQPHA
jgi:Ca2+-binding RTX toxin-like protein